MQLYDWVVLTGKAQPSIVHELQLLRVNRMIVYRTIMR